MAALQKVCGAAIGMIVIMLKRFISWGEWNYVKEERSPRLYIHVRGLPCTFRRITLLCSRE
jgi:hypothetical protein